MADREFKIKIITSAEGAGAAQTAGELNDLSEKTKQYVESLKGQKEWGDKAELSGREMRFGLALIAPELSHLGHVMGLLQAGPMGLLLASLGAMAKMFESIREQANAAAPKDADGNPAFKLSVNDFVIKAWAAALQRVPAANAVWAEDCILRFRRSDIGIAVAVEGGLITPLMRSADTKTLSVISQEMKGLSARARAKKLKPDEYQGGSSAISNLGMYGVREFSAIINPPHSTILAVGAARRQAIETEAGGVAFASVMSVTLSCDHRVVDGALGAELLAAFRGCVEQPVTMLV